MLIRPVVALSALLLAGAAVAAEDKWEITSSFEMTGMPFQMPPQTQTLCLPQNQPASEKMVPVQDNCKVSKFTTSGSTSRFHIECPPPQQMSGDGEFTSLGKDAYKGSMSARANIEGRMADMKITYSGRKLGVCGGDNDNDNAFSPMKMMQQQQATQGMMCTQMVESLSWQMAPQLASMCPTIKADICARVKTKFAAAATSQGLLALQEERSDWQQLGAYCGIDTAAVTKNACAGAKRAQNWNDAVLLCGDDPELDAAAKKECIGMKFTGNPRAQALRPLCEQYADKLPKPAAAPAQAVPAAVDSGASMIDTGAKALESMKKLKGLFGR